LGTRLWEPGTAPAWACGLALRKSYRSGAGYTFYSYEDLEARYSYDNEGRVVSVTYPKGGPTYTYSFDGMGRPVQMSDDAGKVWAKEAQYEAGGRLAAVKLWEHDGYGYPKFVTEQRSYNARGQLTRLTIPRYLDEEYIYPAGNAGRIERKKDWVSGEEVVYQYDELNRLIHAETTGPEWGLSFSYDGFGNRTAQTVTKGSGPSWNELIDSATNRLVSNYYNRYDANGNQTRVPWPGYGYATLYYDKLNRLVKVDSPDGKEYYEYSPFGDRVWRKQEASETTEWYYFYGAYGRLLAVYEQNGTEAFDLRLRFRNISFLGDRGRPARIGGRTRCLPRRQRVRSGAHGTHERSVTRTRGVFRQIPSRIEVLHWW